jgi:hypothetical protein
MEDDVSPNLKISRQFLAIILGSVNISESLYHLLMIKQEGRIFTC